MINDILNRYAVCANPQQFDGFSQILDAIDSIDAVEVLITYCIELLNRSQVDHLVQQYTFELFNAVYTLTVSESLHCTLSESLVGFVEIMRKYCPARELYLVAAERLLSGAAISSLPFVLYTLQASLVDMESIDVFNAGKFTSLLIIG